MFLEETKDSVNLNAVSNSGVTPLMLAVKCNNIEVVEILLSRGANPFLKDQLGREATDYNYSISQQNTEGK